MNSLPKVQRFGGIEEIEPLRQRSFLKRLFAPHQRWNVYLKAGCVGSIEIRYPVDKRSRVYLNLSDEQYPIVVAQRMLSPETGYILPPDSPSHRSVEFEWLHFLTALCVRFMIIELEYNS